ncbi:diacylglycerol kinase family protein [Nocardioides iriomotensis]|nr:diacylglycerol kinase family protein [Nocardioides iriomotensis]
MTFTRRTRRAMTVWAVLCAVVVVSLAVLVKLDRLDVVDSDVGVVAFDWTSAQTWLVGVLLFIDHAFGTVAMTVYTAIAAVALWTRKHRRPAYWTVGVMLAASLTTTGLKNLIDRERPVWEQPLHLLQSYSFPSGHSSGIASGAGVAIMLSLILVRRRSVQRAVVFVALTLVLVVGADRVLLGVHNLTDVVAGYAVGVFWVLAGALLYDPTPRARPVEAFASPVPTTRQVAVVLNPIKVDDVPVFKAMLERTAAELGWSRPSWYETTIEDPGRAMAEQAAIDGADLVIVCGGDGTVRTVCGELAGTGISVGVLPAGTGNLLARNLDIPLFLQAAIDVAFNGQDRAIDLVKISGDGIPEDSHFMVMAGMGFDAAIMEGASEEIKAKVGWLAYVVSGVKNLMFPPVRLEVSVDDGPWTKHRARTVVVGNVGYLTAGMPLLPDAAIDDGILDVVLLHPSRFLSWIPLALRVLSKGKRSDELVNRMTGKKVSIRARDETPRQLDGDAIGPGQEMCCEVLHGRLLVRVPR